MSLAPHCQRLQKALGQAPLVFHIPNAQPTRSSMWPNNSKTNTSQICSNTTTATTNVSNGPPHIDTRRVYVHNRPDTSGTTATSSTTGNSGNNGNSVFGRDQLSLRHVRNRQMYSSLGIEKIHEILKRLVSYGFETSADIAKMQPWQLRVLKKSTPQIDRIYLQAFPVWGTNDYYDDYANKTLRQFVDCAVWLEHNEIYLIIASFYLGCDDDKVPKVPGYKCFICQHDKDLTSLDELRWHVWLHHRNSPDMAKAMAESRERYWNFVDLSSLNRISKKGPVIDLCVDSDSDDNGMTQSTTTVSSTNTKHVDKRRRAEKSQSSSSESQKNSKEKSSHLTQQTSKNTTLGKIPAIDIMNVGHFHPVTRRTEDMISPMEMEMQMQTQVNGMEVDSEEMSYTSKLNTHQSNNNNNNNSNNNNNNNNDYHLMSTNTHSSNMNGITYGDIENTNNNHGFDMGFNISMSGSDWFGENEFFAVAHNNSNSNSNSNSSGYHGYHDTFTNDYFDDNGPSNFDLASVHDNLQDTPPSWPNLLGDSFSSGV